MERETPITTDLTGGKKADMKRPTKPVMWTDEEASNRLYNYLYPKICRKGVNVTNFRYLYYYRDGENGLEICLPNKPYCYEEKMDKAINMSYLLLNISKDSLLHDLNIIKPVGRLEYESKWIDKILSGQKTMDILPVQHTCGYYELWDTDRQKVRGIVEVTQVEKWNPAFWFREIMNESYNIFHCDCEGGWNNESIELFPCFWKASGFDSAESFIAYHRTHFQSVKYAITYWVVDMKGDAE